MNVIGINIGIGPSVCLLRNGVPIFAIEEERLNRIKNTMGFPTLALRYVHRHFEDFAQSCDRIAITNLDRSYFTKEQFYGRYDRKMAPRGPVMRARDSFWRFRQRNKSDGDITAKRAREAAEIRDEVTTACPSLSLPLDRYAFVKHHDCHAAAAYYGLALEKDRKYLVLTLDGGGDSECATVQVGHDARLNRVSATPSGNSIGNIYSIVTYLLGLTPHEHEYKLMGLAAYVPDRYRREAAALFEGFVGIDPNDPMRFTHGSRPRTTDAHRAMAEVLRRKRFDNVAGGLQQFTEDLVLTWVKNCIRETGVTDVLFSGGVFMNVVINKLIAELDEVTSLAVFPSCGDETNSFGAAFQVHADHTGELADFTRFTLGPDPFREIDGVVDAYRDRCDFRAVEDTAAETARLLSDGKILARCQGGMEFGARALGNRSVLADPTTPDAVEKINATIKQRDFWMPFAPAILNEDLRDYVTVPGSLIRENPSPYMMVVMDSLEDKREAMAAALHRFDKTARVEVVDETYNAGFYEVLSEFKKLTGRSCLLNTSFNVHGHPIVCTAEEAIEILLSSTLDAVVLDGYVVTRKA